jgi:hypothetical protein
LCELPLARRINAETNTAMPPAFVQQMEGVEALDDAKKPSLN